MQLFKRLGMYWKYSTRSLARGGQRTLLAIFCVAVGVLAIVALQLVGNMVDKGLTSNVRDGNGGDLSVRSDVTGFSAQELATFDQLQVQGVITTYTKVAATSAESDAANGDTQFYTIRAVDPAHFPIAGAPVFTDPSGGSLPALLSGDNVVITEDLQTRLGLHVGDTTKVITNDGRSLQVTMAGVLASQGFFNSAQMVMAADAYAAAPSSAGLPIRYTAVYANVPGDTDANAAAAKVAIQNALPLANVSTTQDTLQQNQDQVQQIRYFLQIVGLLALLIGGVGIINTMQVLLRRRRTEIAMLKTAGYRRADLYALFGVEAGLLGLAGGVLGSAAGIGVSLLVKGLFERAFFLRLPTVLDPFTIGSGVVIGLVTALIFGIMPIVQASQIRPLAVLRELPEGAGAQGAIITVLLAALLAALFAVLAYSILQNLSVTVGAVGGAGIFLGILSLFFTLVVFLIGRIPVLERFTWWYLLLIAAGLAIAVAATLAVPAFGVLLLAVSLAGLVIVPLPRIWKSNVRMGLRNIGRTRSRTVTTLVALFIGVFAIGLILSLGQNIKDKVNNALTTVVKYNSFVIAGNTNKSDVEQAIAGLQNVQGQVVNVVAQAVPVAVNQTPVTQLFPPTGDNRSGESRIGKREALSYLSGVEGYDLAGKSLPDVTIAKGRNLTADDAGTTNVVVPARMAFAPLNIKPGDTITLQTLDHKTPVTLHVVGVLDARSAAFSIAGILGDDGAAQTLSAGNPFYVYSLKLEPKAAHQQLEQVQKAVPSAQTFSLVDALLVVISLLNNVLLLLTGISSLALVAGLIIIANAVALAMLERRRELGILKAVGHTSRSILSEVLLENGVIGFTGGFLAMGLVALALTVLGKIVFNTDFGVGASLVLGVIFATAAVCMLIAAFVAVRATRVRPLEVLRYE
jgi:putative ABC transport system permease protein